MSQADRPDHGPAAREVDDPAPREGWLERAIATRLRELRREAGTSLAETAARVGVSKAMLSKIENARTSCSLTTLARLAEALDVPVTSFFRDADAPREAVYTEAGGGRADRRARHPGGPRLHAARGPAGAARPDGGPPRGAHRAQ